MRRRQSYDSSTIIDAKSIAHDMCPSSYGAFRFLVFGLCAPHVAFAANEVNKVEDGAYENSYDAQIETQNPFPQIISDDEVNAHIEAIKAYEGKDAYNFERYRLDKFLITYLDNSTELLDHTEYRTRLNNRQFDVTTIRSVDYYTIFVPYADDNHDMVHKKFIFGGWTYNRRAVRGNDGE